MSLWQYTFNILPKESVQEYSPNHDFIKDNEGFDDAFYWKDKKTECNSFESIGNILAKRKSWSKNITLFGDQESNCFEVLCEDGIVISVSFRIDFTSNYESILNELIEFFILKGLLVLDEELNVIPLNYLALREVIENSLQFKKYKELT